jgi:hypothetical protein
MILVRGAKSFALFWYDFVVGDDWRLVVGTVVALGLTAFLAHVVSVAAWWAAPVIVLVVLVVSTMRAARKARAR